MQQRVWRVRFNVVSHPGEHFDADIYNEIVMGRGASPANVIDLTPYDGESLGVSRRHVLLRPTPANLWVMDLGSRHGTLRNAQYIGVKTPYPLRNSDVLTLGRLSLRLIIGENSDADPALVPAYR